MPKLHEPRSLSGPDGSNLGTTHRNALPKKAHMTTRFAMALGVLIAFTSTSAAAQSVVSGEVELFEMHLGDGDDHFVFDSALEFGPLTLELGGGSDVGPDVDEVTAQLTYGVPLGGAATLLIGASHDFRPGDDLTNAVVGLESELLPWLEGETFLALSDQGDLTGSAELVATAPLGGDFTLEPRAEVGWSAQDIAAEETASGLTEMELSIRLRKQLTPFLNAYVGGIHETLLGGTRDIAKANGDEADVNRFIVGIGLEF